MISKANQKVAPEDLGYHVGLSQVREAVVSSHFMHRIARNASLQTYSEARFNERSLIVDEAAVWRLLMPNLIATARAFAHERAAAARLRAREHYKEYGVGNPRRIGTAETVAEVMFDRQFSIGANRTCSRTAILNRVTRRLSAGKPIDMVVPALPFKLPSPLKSRGCMPDLAEINFLVSLYEVVLTIELICREDGSSTLPQFARFTVVSDGSRFNELVNMPMVAIRTYQLRLREWISLLGLDSYIVIRDYLELLQERLPPGVWRAKTAIARKARLHYTEILDPLFDPYDMQATLAAAADLEPDPERANPEGRFVSLLKSLVYTIRYRSLQSEDVNQADRYDLYRAVTANIFNPVGTEIGLAVIGSQSMEQLRQSMLGEVWRAAMNYLAEIKSDRELEEDPILTCLPDYIRWTIHAKSGQIALATPTVGGTAVQPWAGTGMFRPIGKDKVKLCAYPVVALEAADAFPVRIRSGDEPGADEQPLFYIDRAIECEDLGEFFCSLPGRMIRQKTNWFFGHRAGADRSRTRRSLDAEDLASVHGDAAQT